MRKYSSFLKMVWWIYIVLLFLFVIIKFRGSLTDLMDKVASTPFGTNYNFVPFRSVRVQLSHITESWALINLLGNIIPFVPFGCLFPLVCRRANTFVKSLFAGIVFVLFVETFQFFTRLGSFDVDDIILNMRGIFIGYLLIWLCTIIKNRKR